MLLGAPRWEKSAKEGDKKKGKHARAKTWGADLFGGGGGGSGVPTAEPKQFSTPTKPRRGRASTAPRESAARKSGVPGTSGPGTNGPVDPVTSTLAERAPRPTPIAVDELFDATSQFFPRRRNASTGDAGRASSAEGQDDGVPGPTFRRDVHGFGDEGAETSAAPTSPKVVVVKYLKVNDVALKVSYDGPPKSFHEVRLLLDASTHAGFVGRWRELIDRVKKNVVWSVLKSVTGLQGRRLPGGAAGSASTASAAFAGETSHSAFGNRSKGITVIVDGFEGFEGDLDFAEGLTALGSPTAAAMVAESDGLVVPASRSLVGASVWRRVFGGGHIRGGAEANAAGAKEDTRGADRAALLSSWGKRPR